jgi:hypothetical protein
LPSDPDREHTPPPASDPTDALLSRKGAQRLEKFETGGGGKKVNKVFDSKDHED